jgi:nitrogen PTS system EIIA component
LFLFPAIAAFFPNFMYLNLIQLAESFGVSEKVVEGWIRNEGLPHTPDRGILLFDRAQVVQWAATRGLATQAGFLAAAPAALETPWRLGPLLRTGGIWHGVPAGEVPEVFAKVAAALPGVTPPVRQMLAQRLRGKGGVSLAPVGGGFALPHPSARISLGRDSGAVALILLSSPLAPDELRVDDVPVTRLLFFIAPSPRAHLDMIGRLSRLVSRGSLRDLLAKDASDEEIFRNIEASEVPSPQAAKGGARA